MKVILTQDVKDLGKKDEVKEVKEGYARNYLIPRGLAEKATKNKLKEVEKKEKLRQEKEEKEIQNAKDLKEKLEQTKLILEAKTGDEGKLFGSITNKDIAEKLKEKGIVTLDKRKVELDENIKDIGTYKVNVKLHSEVEATLTVEVVDSEE